MTSAPELATVVERDVTIETDEGACDAALFYPSGGSSCPAILMWTDVVGLRLVFRDMGRRLAASGYVVLVPNPFYRWSRAPVIEGATDLADPKVRQTLLALAARFTNDGIERDSRAFVEYLDAQPQTDRTRNVGVHGYCMGGQFAFRTAAAAPGRIGAVGSFHGSFLVTNDPKSPHRLIGDSRAGFLVAIAQNDDAAQPDAKVALKQAFAEAQRPATVEVFAANHGWCVEGSTTYDAPLSRKAWADHVAFYARTLT
jgi:carboxymethylenebutenolidase